jgi:predicted dehydrogenase
VEFYTRKVSLKKDEPLKREVEDFITASEKGTEPLVTGSSAVEALRIAEGALESLKTLRKVTIR